jgi:hypothetical protein
LLRTFPYEVAAGAFFAFFLRKVTKAAEWARSVVSIRCGGIASRLFGRGHAAVYTAVTHVKTQIKSKTTNFFWREVLFLTKRSILYYYIAVVFNT